MNRVITLALATLLSIGCYKRPPEALLHPEASELSGSPCIDGLIVNLGARCSNVTTFRMNDGKVVIRCANPLPKQRDDEFWGPYTRFTFYVMDPDIPDEFIPDTLYFHCQDSASAVGYDVEDKIFIPQN